MSFRSLRPVGRGRGRGRARGRRHGRRLTKARQDFAATSPGFKNTLGRVKCLGCVKDHRRYCDWERKAHETSSYIKVIVLLFPPGTDRSN